ncbi:unnamed protein product, partial [Cylindrotheca closterium]
SFYPFDEHVASDHRGLWIDFDLNSLLGGHQPTKSTHVPRRLVMHNKRVVQQYVQLAEQGYMRYNIPGRLSTLGFDVARQQGVITKSQAVRFDRIHGMEDPVEILEGTLHIDIHAKHVRDVDDGLSVIGYLDDWNESQAQLQTALQTIEIITDEKNSLNRDLQSVRDELEAMKAAHETAATMTELSKTVRPVPMLTVDVPTGPPGQTRVSTTTLLSPLGHGSATPATAHETDGEDGEDQPNASFYPFDEHVASDHRGLWIDFDLNSLLGGHQPTKSTHVPRRLVMHNKRVVQQYVQLAEQGYMRYNIPGRLSTLGFDVARQQGVITKSQAVRFDRIHGMEDPVEILEGTLHIDIHAKHVRDVDDGLSVIGYLDDWNESQAQLQTALQTIEIITDEKNSLNRDLQSVRDELEAMKAAHETAATMTELSKTVRPVPMLTVDVPTGPPGQTRVSTTTLLSPLGHGSATPATAHETDGEDGEDQPNASFYPFDEHVASDHRGLWIDFDLNSLLGGHQPTKSTHVPRRLVMHNKRVVQQYVQLAEQGYMRYNIPGRLSTLGFDVARQQGVITKSQAVRFDRIHGMEDPVEILEGTLHIDIHAKHVRDVDDGLSVIGYLDDWNESQAQLQTALQTIEIITDEKNSLNRDLQSVRDELEAMKAAHETAATMTELSKTVRPVPMLTVDVPTGPPGQTRVSTTTLLSPLGHGSATPATAHETDGEDGEDQPSASSPMDTGRGGISTPTTGP